MKTALISATVVAMIASAALAAPNLFMIAPLPGDGETEGRAITPDGKYVAGVSGSTHGVFWSPTAGTFNVSYGGMAATVVTGIGYRTVAAGQELVAFGLSAGWATAYGATVSGGSPTWLWSARDVDTGTTPALPVANSVGGTNSANWYAAFDDQPGSGNDRLWVAKGQGDPTGTMTDTYAIKTTLYEGTHVRGVSGTGRAVGTRKNVSAGPNQNYYWDYALPSPSQTQFMGLNGSSAGEAWAVSLDGTRIGGCSPVLGGLVGNWPYLYTVSTGTISELPTLSPSEDIAGTNAVVYGLSSDGRYAVGMDYTKGYELAVLWDTQSMMETDLTAYAADNGILGGFVDLRRAYSVGVNDLGEAVITGSGQYLGSLDRGFVLTVAVPEPGTIGLLALSGAAVLVRRKRK